MKKQTQTDKHNESNRIAALIVLSDPNRHGGEGSALVRWARLWTAKNTKAVPVRPLLSMGQFQETLDFDLGQGQGATPKQFFEGKRSRVESCHEMPSCNPQNSGGAENRPAETQKRSETQWN